MFFLIAKYTGRIELTFSWAQILQDTIRALNSSLHFLYFYRTLIFLLITFYIFALWLWYFGDWYLPMLLNSGGWKKVVNWILKQEPLWSNIIQKMLIVKCTLFDLLSPNSYFSCVRYSYKVSRQPRPRHQGTSAQTSPPWIKDDIGW